ncbi:MAG TPA: hypothetical protein VGT41_06290 [Candidatus Babeliales bacterium]|nr:hypothetical protein [Candidatus Babeliales bacterium]
MRKKLIYIVCLVFCFDMSAAAENNNAVYLTSIGGQLHTEYYAALQQFRCAMGECTCRSERKTCHVPRADLSTITRSALLRMFGLRDVDAKNLVMQSKQRYEAYMAMITCGLENVSIQQSLQPDGTTALRIDEPQLSEYYEKTKPVALNAVKTGNIDSENEQYDGLKEYEQAFQVACPMEGGFDYDASEAYDAPPKPLKQTAARASRFPSPLSLPDEKEDDESEPKNSESQIDREHNTPPLVPLKKFKPPFSLPAISPSSSEDGDTEKTFGSASEYNMRPIGKKGMQRLIAKNARHNLAYLEQYRRFQKAEETGHLIDKVEMLSWEMSKMSCEFSSIAACISSINLQAGKYGRSDEIQKAITNARQERIRNIRKAWMNQANPFRFLDNNIKTARKLKLKQERDQKDTAMKRLK